MRTGIGVAEPLRYTRADIGRDSFQRCRQLLVDRRDSPYLQRSSRRDQCAGNRSPSALETAESRRESPNHQRRGRDQRFFREPLETTSVESPRHARILEEFHMADS